MRHIIHIKTHSNIPNDACQTNRAKRDRFKVHALSLLPLAEMPHTCLGVLY